ncbi:uncharacterized protein B4U79_00822, partial [Dinothrombium tinctorium]
MKTFVAFVIVSLSANMVNNQEEKMFRNMQIKAIDTYDFRNILQIDQTRRKRNYNRKVGVGGYCKSSDECLPSNCCVIISVNRRGRCQSLATFRQRCSIGQVKGGQYANSCPCASGDRYCKPYRYVTNIYGYHIALNICVA